MGSNVADLLLAEMTQIVTDWGGVIEKCTGDGLMELVGSDQDKSLSPWWGNFEKKRLLLALEWQFQGRNRPDKEF